MRKKGEFWCQRRTVYRLKAYLSEQINGQYTELGHKWKLGHYVCGVSEI